MKEGKDGLLDTFVEEVRAPSVIPLLPYFIIPNRTELPITLLLALPTPS
jgi:hypothetical protein